MVRSIKAFDKSLKTVKKPIKKQKVPPPSPIDSSDEDTDSDSDNETIVFKKITKPIKAHTKQPPRRQPKPVKAIETMPYIEILDHINKLNGRFDEMKTEMKQPPKSDPIPIPKKEFPPPPEKQNQDYLMSKILKF